LLYAYLKGIALKAGRRQPDKECVNDGNRQAKGKEDKVNRVRQGQAPERVLGLQPNKHRKAGREAPDGQRCRHATRARLRFPRVIVTGFHQVS
jgi:hypothetical protein